MNTELIRVESKSIDRAIIDKVVDVLNSNGVVGIPTETVYGLAANSKDKDALDRLYDIKKRPKDKPFTIQIAEISQLRYYIDDISPKLDLILKKYWPGPLTIIVKGKKGDVGLRIPNNRAALSILKHSGMPLAVTSANISGESSAISAEEAFNRFKGSVDIIIDDGKMPKGVESTILDCRSEPFTIARKGAMAAEIERLL